MTRCVASNTILSGFAFNARINTNATTFKLAYDIFYGTVSSKSLTIKICGFAYPGVDFSSFIGVNGTSGQLTVPSTIQLYNNNRYVLKIIGIKYPTS